MPSHVTLRSAVALSMVALASAHGLIFSASCDGQTQARGFGLMGDDQVPRDGKTPNVHQVDSPILRDSEVKDKIANKCGRTQINGNIDTAEETENAIKNNTFAICNPGDTLTVTMHVVNTDGGGPYVGDIDETNNAGQFVKQLEIQDNVPGLNGLNVQNDLPQDFKMTMRLPPDMNCKGGTTGNMCAVRLRNTAVAGPFGGCFAVQQAGAKGLSLVDPAQVLTKDKSEDVDGDRETLNKNFATDLQSLQQGGSSNKDANNNNQNQNQNQNNRNQNNQGNQGNQGNQNGNNRNQGNGGGRGGEDGGRGGGRQQNQQSQGGNGGGGNNRGQGRQGGGQGGQGGQGRGRQQKRTVMQW